MVPELTMSTVEPKMSHVKYVPGQQAWRCCLSLPQVGTLRFGTPLWPELGERCWELTLTSVVGFSNASRAARAASSFAM